MNKIKVWWMFQLCFNFNKIHDSVGKAWRTANQARVTPNSHALSSSFHPDLTILLCGINACFRSISTGQKLPAKRKYANHLVNCPFQYTCIYKPFCVEQCLCPAVYIFKLGCIRCKNSFTDGTFMKNNNPTWRPDFRADFRFYFFHVV
jgi:hypothetical protein